MTEALWEIEDSSNTGSRALSAKEKEYLMTGDPGSYTYAKMDRRVRKKFQQLPQRIQELIDDIALIHHGEKFEPAVDSAWQDLLDFSPRAQLVRDEPVVRTSSTRAAESIELGFEIGSILRMLGGGSPEADFVWGAIIGLYGEPAENYEREAETLVNLFDDLKDRRDQRLVSTKTIQKDEVEEERAEVRDVLIESGFAPAPPLVEKIVNEHLSSESVLLSDNSNPSWVADPEETDHPPHPSKRPSSEEMRRSSIQLTVRRAEQETILPTVDELAKDLREDAIRIQDEEWRGIDPEQILQQLGEQTLYGSDEEFNGVNKWDIPQGGGGKPNVTYTLEKLASSSTDRKNRPILEETEGNPNYWRLTSYGKLLYKVRYEHNCSTNWMYTLIGGEENQGDAISRALESC